MQSLARFCYRRRRYVVAAWVALVVGLFALSNVAGGSFKTEFNLPGSESQQALDILSENGFINRTGDEGQIVFETADGFDDRQVRDSMEALFARVEAEVPGAEVGSPYADEADRQVNDDGTVAYASISFSDRDWEGYMDAGEQIRELREEIAVSGLTIELGGQMFAEPYEPSSEVIGLIAAIIILVIAFGSLLAMGLPIVTALIGISCGIALIGLTTRFLNVPDFTVQTAAMIGIGVGIDYALLIITRYRQGLHDGLDPEESTLLSLNTAGRAVIFAGFTVVISLLGMFVVQLDAIRAVAIGSTLAVLMTMLASVTLLPALFGFVGNKIDRFGLPHRSAAEQVERESLWLRWSHFIQRNPWPAALASVAVLLLMTAPVLTMRLGFADAGNRPENDTSRRAFDLLSEGFGPGFNGPLIIAAETPNEVSRQALQRIADLLPGVDGVASTSPPITNDAQTAALITVYPDSAPQDEETTQLVHRLRDDVIPPAAGSDVDAKVSGSTAGAVDFTDYTSQRIPLFFGVVLMLSFILLLLVFRSIIVPLKAVIMNLLSIGAAFGVMVAVFQWGWGADIVGIGREGPIEAWVPMMLFAIVFGLSMDYEVFLLSRIKEEYDRHGDNSRAVADGLAATGRVITAAAAIMVCVFGSFVLGDDRAIKLMGFGLAVAIFIDATLVRLVLVPAAMELLGNRNWWAPGWLKRLLPSIKIEADERTPLATVAERS